jgi:DNA-binding NtrC family response regulator
MKDWKVLLVDDEEEFVLTLAERLEFRDIRADVTFNGYEAIRKIDREAPHLVVLDLLMPGLMGLDVLRYIRKEHPQTKVIVLTGHGELECNHEARRLGASHCLFKPVRIEVLIEKMMEALEHPKSDLTGG